MSFSNQPFYGGFFMKKAVALFCVVAAVLMVTCAKKDNPTGPGGNAINTMTYTVSGDKIIVSNPQTIYTECDSNNILVSDTTHASIDTATFVLSNNNNFMVVKHSDGEIDSLTRVGTGSSIQGQWTSARGYTVDIGASTITLTLDYADMLVSEFDYMSSYVNVTIAKTSSNSVTITGNISHEVVTISINSSTGDVTYSSTVSSHAAATVYANPTSCPNDGPAWLEEFFMANPKIAKNAVSAPTSSTHRLLTLLTKKPAPRW